MDGVLLGPQTVGWKWKRFRLSFWKRPLTVFLFTLICDVTKKRAAAQKPRRLWIDCCAGRGEDPIPWKCSRLGELDVVGGRHLQSLNSESIKYFCCVILHQLIKFNSHPEGMLRAEKLFKVTLSVLISPLPSGLWAMCGANTQSDMLGFLPVQLPLPHHSLWINCKKPADSWAGSTQSVPASSLSEGLLAKPGFVQDELCCSQLWAGFVPPVRVWSVLSRWDLLGSACWGTWAGCTAVGRGLTLWAVQPHLLPCCSEGGELPVGYFLAFTFTGCRKCCLQHN